MDNRHTHQLEEETYVSEDDGSCIVCRDEAVARGDCSACYGRGRFDVDEEPYSFECHACRGTGRLDVQREQTARQFNRAFAGVSP